MLTATQNCIQEAEWAAENGKPTTWCKWKGEMRDLWMQCYWDKRVLVIDGKITPTQREALRRRAERIRKRLTGDA